jgi:hypothetical protein
MIQMNAPGPVGPTKIPVTKAPSQGIEFSGTPVTLPGNPVQVPQLSFDQKKQLCLGWLRDEFLAYQHGGGTDSLQAWVQSEVEQAQMIQGHTAERKAPAGSSDPPPPPPNEPGDARPQVPHVPNEPGLVSEGLGPITWLVWGAKDALGFAAEKAWEELGDGLLADWIIEGVEETIDGMTAPAGPGDGTTGAGDGSYGTSPGQGSGLDGFSPPDNGDGTGPTSSTSGDPVVPIGDGSTGPTFPDGTGTEGGGDGCFVAGTVVHTGDGDRVAIEEVALDAKLASCDILTGVVSVGTVTRRFDATSAEIVTIVFAGEVLRCTPRHRFYATSGWMPAGGLSAGIEVRCIDGATRKVLAVSREPAETAVFNLRVDRQHTYYVGEAGYLVHNAKDANVDNGQVGDDLGDDRDKA